jgi:hypothetical protein
MSETSCFGIKSLAISKMAELLGYAAVRADSKWPPTDATLLRRVQFTLEPTDYFIDLQRVLSVAIAS